jgi:hypothetical protein
MILPRRPYLYLRFPEILPEEVGWRSGDGGCVMSVMSRHRLAEIASGPPTAAAICRASA